MVAVMEELKKIIRDIPDFPKPGILFKDITPLLNDPRAFQRAVDALVERHGGKTIDRIVGIESRGFIFGSALAYRLGVGFVPVRKPGKLPYRTKKVEYTLEYGRDALEMHEDAIRRGEGVLIVDDLLATGGTAGAVVQLVREMGGKIQGCAFVVELTELGGRKRLGDIPVDALIQF